MGYARLESYAEAHIDLSKAIAIGPRYFEAYKERGKLTALRGLHTQALTDFNAAIQIQPNYSDAFYNRALVYLQQENYRAAKAGIP